MLQLKAPAKLNLFLHVTGQRADGYHLLQSLFVPINWCDDITIRLSPDGAIRRLSSHPWPAEDDICIKAAERLKALAVSRGQMPASQGCEISIDKHIPHGAGLGGGSSDAAACLNGLVDLWGLHLSSQDLLATGLALGADVPFFLKSEPAVVTGIGETLQACKPMAQHFVVVVPRIEIATAKIFQSTLLERNNPALEEEVIEAALSKSIWTAGRNDLLRVALGLFPSLQEDLDLLVKASQAVALPAKAVRMSGSGSALFCSCESQAQADHLAGWLRSRPSSARRFRGVRAVKAYL